jgi:hypothetical protein
MDGVKVESEGVREYLACETVALIIGKSFTVSQNTGRVEGCECHWVGIGEDQDATKLWGGFIIPQRHIWAYLAVCRLGLRSVSEASAGVVEETILGALESKGA